MSDVREVSEYTVWFEGSLYGYGEKMQDAINDMVEAMRITEMLHTIISAADVAYARLGKR